MRTYKPRPPRVEQVCTCGQPFTPAPKGPPAARCKRCRAALRLAKALLAVLDPDVIAQLPAKHAADLGAKVDAKSKRLKRRAGVLP